MENVESIANSVSSNLLVADMNDNYSDEKEMICRALKIISNSVDADIFVCDTEGNIILCKERADSLPFFGKFGNCSYHTDYNISDTILRQVYESSYVGNGVISGQRSYIVGCPIYSSNQIIGSVFATSRATTAELVHAVFKTVSYTHLLKIKFFKSFFHSCKYIKKQNIYKDKVCLYLHQIS